MFGRFAEDDPREQGEVLHVNVPALIELTRRSGDDRAPVRSDHEHAGEDAGFAAGRRTQDARGSRGGRTGR